MGRAGREEKMGAGEEKGEVRGREWGRRREQHRVWMEIGKREGRCRREMTGRGNRRKSGAERERERKVKGRTPDPGTATDNKTYRGLKSGSQGETNTAESWEMHWSQDRAQRDGEGFPTGCTEGTEK